jgi:predicted  nucleic acid-binding Zn-ribbon protein
MSEAVLITLIGGFITLAINFISTWSQMKKLKLELALKEKSDDKARKDGEFERDARAAKDLSDVLSSVVESLRSELNAMNDKLLAANQKIEHLTAVVEEYSRGVDMLIEQIRKDGGIPVYTKKTIQEHKFHIRDNE